MGGDRDDCKVYVGNLPDYVRSRDLEDVFYKYGKIVDIDIHSTRGGGAPFAFVLFEDDRGDYAFSSFTVVQKFKVIYLINRTCSFVYSFVL